MDAKKIVDAFLFKYPGRNIVLLPPENPLEIICEIEPTSEHPDYSIAVAAIDKSEPHCHKASTETYEVLRGRLILKLANRNVILYPGMNYVILPKTVHSAEADAAVVRVTSRPGWTPEDHVLVNEH